MQKHYIRSSVIRQSNDIPNTNTPEPNKKLYKDYESVRKIVLEDEIHLPKQTVKLLSFLICIYRIC